MQHTAEKYNQDDIAKYSGKTLADFVIQRREKPDLFAWCEEFNDTEIFLRDVGESLCRRVMLSSNANRVTVRDHFSGEPKNLIMMGSNSYLGLNDHPKVKAAMVAAVEKYGVGAGSPPHFSGYYDVHEQLEANLAEMKGSEAAVIFPSGYATNVGILSCFLGANDTVILDKLSHASIIDGAKLSGAKINTFRHNDMASLERVLKQTKETCKGDRLVVIEGVYSMDGDIAPLDEIYKLVKQYDAKLMVDEAHSTGVLGKTGKGSPEQFNLEGKIDIIMGTFSKSLGGLGGFATGKASVMNYLKHYSRAYFFAASPTPPQVAAQNAALELLRDDPSIHAKLWQNIDYFHSELKKRGFDIENSCTAITPILIGDTVKTANIAKFMHENGIFVNPVPYPAVPRKKDRLRLSVSASLNKEDLDEVLRVLDLANAKFSFPKRDYANGSV